MLARSRGQSSTVDARLLISTGAAAEVPYRSEFMRLAVGDGLGVHHTFTRDPRATWSGFTRRLDADIGEGHWPPPARCPRIFVCGPTAFRRPTCSFSLATSRDIPVKDFGRMGGEPGSTCSADD
jgi:hypothetical protein